MNHCEKKRMFCFIHVLHCARGRGEGEGEGRRKGASFGKENLYFELKTWGIMQGKINK